MNTTDIARARPDGAWVDDLFLVGPATEPCLIAERTLTRADLRMEVASRQTRLEQLKVDSGSSVVVQLPPGIEQVAVILAVWRLGAQLVLLDHRVPQGQRQQLLDRYGAHAVVSGQDLPTDHAQTPCYLAGPGRSRQSEHVLIQFTSGSSGQPKGIGRTVADLVDEVEKIARVDGVPTHGERIVLAVAFAHAYGLFTGLLHALHCGAGLALPEHVTPRGLLQCVEDSRAPVTILGVPFHLQLLATVTQPVRLPQFCRMVSAGEAVDPALCDLIAERFAIQVGQVYGMTETGMIAADLSGRLRPAVGVLAPGVEARVEAGELLVGMKHSPYIDQPEHARWRDGWLHTGDAATVGPGEHVFLHGRCDSQVAVGGLKVDLIAVEQVLASIDGVKEAVVVHDRGIRAYLVPSATASLDRIRTEASRKLAPHQCPYVYHLLSALPVTATGKRIRDPGRLAAAYEGEEAYR